MECGKGSCVHGTSFAWKFKNVREMGMKLSGGKVGNGANFRVVFLHPEFWLSSSWPPLIAHAHVAAFLADNPMNMVLQPHLTSVWSARAARQGFWAVLRPQRSFPVTLF